ncbi:MAG: alpha/beta fold hydrolase [Proteobacteria bacterium]|nr:alpha/beta fold hydrolase [Pseudomonadota bacterium]
MKKPRNHFVIAITLILFGSLLAWFVQTAGGNTIVKEVRFPGSAGNMMSALLYVPAQASIDKPAPGVLAIHGYINSRETQSGFAIEFARRGYVVLALDQTGHGYSDPPAFAHGFGGPDGLAYLRSLPFVDQQKIGLEGHSMGGWAIQMAAANAPDDYTSMVLAGSSTGTFGAPEGTPEHPRNLLLVFSLFDEFSQLMWGTEVPADIVNTAKLKTLFDTQDAVVPGETYGDLQAGTARKLMMPAVTHPGDHLSREAIGASIEWFDLTLKHNSAIDPADQIWFWKELGTLAALIGAVLLIFPTTHWLFSLSRFKAVASKPLPVMDQSPLAHRVNLAAAMIIPVLTFFPLQSAGQALLPGNAFLPQQITNGILFWAWGTGLITIGMFYFWQRKRGKTLADLGMPLEKEIILNATLIALLSGGCLYLTLLTADFFLKVDFRFWVVALKLLSPAQFGIFLVYLLPFTLYFLVLSLSLHNPLRRDINPGKAMWLNGLTLSGGFALLLVFQYLPLLSGGTLAIPSQPLLSIIAFQFVPLLFMVGAVSTYCFERTGNIYTGAFLNGMLVTWYMVAGTATQALPFWL